MRRSSFLRLMNLKAPVLPNAWTDAARAASSGSNWAAAHKKRHEEALARHAALLGSVGGAVPLDGDPGFDEAYAAAWDDYNDCGNVREMDPKNALVIALDLARRANAGDTDFTAPDRSFYDQYVAAHPEFAASDSGGSSGGSGQSGDDGGLSGSVRVSGFSRNSRGAVAVGFTDSTVSPPVHRLVQVGREDGGWTCVSADFDAGPAVLEKDGKRISVSEGRGPDVAGATGSGDGGDDGGRVFFCRESRERRD